MFKDGTCQMPYAPFGILIFRFIIKTDCHGCPVGGQFDFHVVIELKNFAVQSQKAPAFVIEDGFPRCVKNSLDSTGFEPIHRKHQCTALRFGYSIDYIDSHHFGEVTEMVCSVKISAQILGDITEMVYSVKVSAQS